MRVLHNTCLALSAIVSLTSAVELETQEDSYYEHPYCDFNIYEPENSKKWVHPYWLNYDTGKNYEGKYCWFSDWTEKNCHCRNWQYSQKIQTDNDNRWKIETWADKITGPPCDVITYNGSVGKTWVIPYFTIPDGTVWNEQGRWCYSGDFEQENYCRCKDWGKDDDFVKSQNAIRTAVELETKASGEAPCTRDVKSGTQLWVHPYFTTPTSAPWNEEGRWCYYKDWQEETCGCDDWKHGNAGIIRLNKENKDKAIREKVDLEAKVIKKAPCEKRLKGNPLWVHPYFTTPSSAPWNEEGKACLWKDWHEKTCGCDDWKLNAHFAYDNKKKEI